MKKLMLMMVAMLAILVLAACTPEEEDNDPIQCAPGFELVDDSCVEIEEEEDVNQHCPFGETFADGACTEIPDLELEIVGQSLFLNGEPFYIQGICWNPVPKGGNHPRDLDFEAAVDVDADLMQAAGINVIRTYEPITDRETLDTLYEHGIYVINTVYSYGGSSVSRAVSIVEDLKDHPAILMWAIGNEWNYNFLYYDMSLIEARERINEVAAAIKEVDRTHPVTTIYGYLPSSFTIQSMPDIDIWGLNVYSGITFGNLFQDWARLSDKPMYLAEYGADSWNANIGALDEESQAEATRTLTQIIINESSGSYPENRSIGGTIFSFNDEWWKDSSGSLDTQDTGGFAPGGGPYPDNTFNEEYWGIVDIDRNPRQAYYALQELYVGSTEE